MLAWATALGNEGLIVPVIHRAQTLDLFGIAARLNGARDGGTRWKTLAGCGAGRHLHDFESWRERQSSRGAHRDQLSRKSPSWASARSERRLTVQQVDGVDSISVRPMCHLTLSIDHRALDGFQANAFLSAVVSTLHTWPAS